MEDLPIIPVQLFKLFDLRSVKKDKIFKKLVSSGTSGQAPSKIYLDKNNALAQTKALDIISKMISDKRLPMIIVDKNPNLDDRNILNAKSAAIYGFQFLVKITFIFLTIKIKLILRALSKF